jgi:DNA invertase Pin-like site-specific DNA recombinase
MMMGATVRLKKRKPSNEQRGRLCLEILRVSTPKQVELGGLETQHEECAEIARRNGVTLDARKQVKLPGVSGKYVKDTSEIAQLREDLESGDYHGVVMVEDTRLMRPDEPEDQVLLQMFKDNAITIYTKTAAYDTGSAEGMMIFQMLSLFNGRERRMIRQRTYNKRLNLRARGLCSSSVRTIPYGVELVRYRDAEADRWAYAYDDAKISQVRRAFDLVVEGKLNYLQIARETKLAYHGLMRHVLRNTAYIGYRTYDAEIDPSLNHVVDGRIISQTRVRRHDEDVERVPMLGADGKPLSPAIPPDLFWHAQKIIEHKAGMKARRNSTSVDNFLFRNFLRCARCGERLVTRPHRQNGSVREYYICRGSRSGWHMNRKNETNKIELECNAPQIRRERLDALLEAQVAEKLRDPFRLFEMLKAHAAATMRGDNGQRIEQLKKEVAALESEKKQCIVLFKKALITEAELDRDIERLDRALKAAQRILNSLTPAASMVSSKVLAQTMGPFENWGVVRMTVSEKRSLLTTVCPVFNILIEGEKGRGRTAEGASVLGLWVGLADKDAQADKQPLPVNYPKSGIPELVSDLSRCSMKQITDQSNIYIPF